MGKPIIFLLLCMIFVTCVSGSFAQESEQALRSEIEKMEKQLGENHPDLIPLYVHMSKYYMKRQDHEKAEMCFLREIHLIETNYEEISL